MRLMRYWKSMLNLKEIRKGAADLKILERFLKFTYDNLNEKLRFWPIFTLIFQDLCHFIQLWKIMFLQQFFSVSMRFSPSPCRRLSYFSVPDGRISLLFWISYKFQRFRQYLKEFWRIAKEPTYVRSGEGTYMEKLDTAEWR